MRKSTLKMEDSVKSNIEFPKYLHSAVVCDQTGCGKTFFVLDLLEKEYQGVFENIVILCPTEEWNKAYKTRSWIGDVCRPKDKSIIIVNPVLPDGTENFKNCCVCFFIDSLGAQRCISSMTALPPKSSPRKTDMLSQLAFSGRHAEQSVWVISQRYISVLKDLREQANWVCMFYTKDRDNFEHCLRENDVVPADERQKIKKKNCLKLNTVN